jgi:hypothetical protein
MGFTGLRWGEVVGLVTQYVRQLGIRVEWQLYELDNGGLHRCPPKDESRRLVMTPAWLVDLAKDHIAHTRPAPCSCHGMRYVFSGHRPPNDAPRSSGPRMADVARRAGVSVGSVSAVLNQRSSVAEATRTKVEAAVADLGYVPGSVGEVLAPHWRCNGFATWLFQPATTGWYPRKAPHARRPVPVLADPWPGLPVRGRNAVGEPTPVGSRSRRA